MARACGGKPGCVNAEVLANTSIIEALCRRVNAGISSHPLTMEEAVEYDTRLYLLDVSHPLWFSHLSAFRLIPWIIAASHQETFTPLRRYTSAPV